MNDQHHNDLGVVVATYGSGRCVDVLMSNGDQLSNVSVMSAHASSTSGSHDLPDIGNPPGDARWNLTQAPERYVRAVMSFIRGVPICLGFVFPQANQITFNQINRKIDRHASDAYSTIDQYANTEYYHPSGSYVRWGTSPAHEDLTNLNYQQNWKIAANTGEAPYFNLTVANAANGTVCNIQIDPAGNVAVTNKGNLTVNTAGNAAVNVTGTTTVISTGAAELKAPTVLIDSPATTVTGSLLVEGALTFQSGMTGSSGDGGGDTMTLTGNVGVTGSITSTGDQVAGNISQIGHTHTSESPGDPTSPPIAGT